MDNINSIPQQEGNEGNKNFNPWDVMEERVEKSGVYNFM